MTDPSEDPPQEPLGGGGAAAFYAASLPPRVEVAAGARVELPLHSAAGGGYRWEVAAVSGDPHAASVEVRVGPPPAPSDPPTSAQAPVALVVTGRRAGTRRYAIALARPWQPDRPLLRRDLEVVVR